MCDCASIDTHNAGRRLDSYVRQLLPHVPLGTLMKLLRRGSIRVNQRRAKPSYRLCAGDLVSWPRGLSPPAMEPSPSPARRVELEILFEDNDLLVVSKPARLAAHAGSGHNRDSLIDRVVSYLGAAHAPPGQRPGLVQRLDRDVSGVLILGKHATALRALTLAIERGAIDKRYVALVAGRVSKDTGEIDSPLVRAATSAPPGKPRVFPSADGKPAHTRYRVLERHAATTLLEIEISTGHRHQIRAHLLAAGYPIVGDPRYGPPVRDLGLGLTRPFLHAQSVAFAHPLTAQPLRFNAELPQELAALLQASRAQKTR